MNFIQFYLVLLYRVICISGDSTAIIRRRRWAASSPSIKGNQLRPHPNHSDDAIPVSRLWPPWPFNAFDQKDLNQVRKKPMSLPIIKTKTILMWAYLREKAHIGTLQLQQVAHDFSFHLPSSAPPLFLLALLPSRNRMFDAAATATPIRLMAWDFTRKLALVQMGIVFTSWVDHVIRRNIRLEPLHLQSYTSPFNEAILPPFLPEVEGSRMKHYVHAHHGRSEDIENLDEKKRNFLGYAWDKLYIRTKKFLCKDPSALEEERKQIIHELLALQKLKNYHHGTNHKLEPELTKGYALVTGASRGIGRALAVELARWGIPLILVARSQDTLYTLAQELESCYGVRCHALTADLSDPEAAFMVYNTTKSAGLRVDILVNNAGVCTRGELVDSSTQDINRLLQLNIGAVTTLSQLYGKDMKHQRRGRILFVSSVAAGAPSSPHVAAYSASKAYERSLSMAMSMELAKYGVGVTCLMPGAVKGTSFASSSRIEDALCWKVPGYAMKAPEVASIGVRALLNGAVEVCAGWHNFSFLKFLVPTLPPRLSSNIASWAFHTPIERLKPKVNDENQDSNEDIRSEDVSTETS